MTKMILVQSDHTPACRWSHPDVLWHRGGQNRHHHLRICTCTTASVADAAVAFANVLAVTVLAFNPGLPTTFGGRDRNLIPAVLQSLRQWRSGSWIAQGGSPDQLDTVLQWRIWSG